MQTTKRCILTLGLLNVCLFFFLIAWPSQHRNAESDCFHSATLEKDELSVSETRNWLNKALAPCSFLIKLYKVKSGKQMTLQSLCWKKTQQMHLYKHLPNWAKQQKHLNWNYSTHPTLLHWCETYCKRK